MKCVILSAGDICDYEELKKYIDDGDYIVAADGGYRHLAGFGLSCDYCLGDFDSLGHVPEDADEEYPCQKDDTDTMLAVKHGLLKGYTTFMILGGLGGRLDHTLANVSTLEYLRAHGASGILADERTVVQFCCAGDKIHPMLPGEYYSIFTFGCEEAIISMHGVEYPLDHHVLRSDFPLGISNKVTNIDRFQMMIHEGKIIVVECKK